jgi:hypothetical protein
MPLSLQDLVLAARRKAFAQEEEKKKKAQEKALAKITIEQILSNILNWEPSGLIFQELHQTCRCCSNRLISVNSVMLEKRNKLTYAIKTAILSADHKLDLSSLPRRKLVVEQDVPMCPECFQLSELIDLCFAPKSLGLETAQKDLFL